jgi:hypothetical protein
MIKGKWFMDLETKGFRIDVMCHTSDACYNDSVKSRVHVCMSRNEDKAIVTVDELDGVEFRQSVKHWEIDEIAAFKLADMYEAFNDHFGLDVDCCFGHRTLDELCQIVDKQIELVNIQSSIFKAALDSGEVKSE